MQQVSTVTATVASEPSAEDVFAALRDFRHLSREHALEALRKGLAAGRFEPEAVEDLALAALRDPTWEAKQGGLEAAAEAVKFWDRPAFRTALLQLVPQLLVDAEYRVRKAVSCVLRECCLRDGLEVFDGLADTVLGDIRDKFYRTSEDEGEDSDPGKPPAPPTFWPDTEGWRSLETSMCALEAMMQGCGEAFTPRIDAAMLELLADCSRHTNRFVREYAYVSFKNIFEVCSRDAFLASISSHTVDLVATGIRDNWSQVRYAASVAARAFVQKAGDHQERFFPQLLGNMCLNRHYVAEGVRLYSQDTWRIICGPQGGARFLMAHFDNVIEAYVSAAEAPNHAVREAACHCISEVAGRVAGSPSCPTPYRQHFTPERVERLLSTVVECFQDESWPVRDVAGTAIGHFVAAFPSECEAYRGQLVGLWFDQMGDNIPSLRRNAASALAVAVGVWMADLWPSVVGKLAEILPSVLQQPEKSETFSDYTPSGPFSVPKPKPASLEEKPDPAYVDQTMFSCGSVAPKTFKRRERGGGGGGGCMNCAADRPHQPWEASEGMVHLLTELAMLNSRVKGEDSHSRAEALASLLPSLASAFACSHYRHHHLLKQRVCERLPALTEALGPELFLPHLPALLAVAAECSAQRAHLALRESARATVAAWSSGLPAGEVAAACAAAGVEPKVLQEAVA